MVEALRGRVLVVDDSDVFLRMAASVISDTSRLRLIGARSGEEAIRLLPRLGPDLVLLDFHLPGMDGIQTTRIIRRDEPRTVVIVISTEPEGLSDVARAAPRATHEGRVGSPLSGWGPAAAASGVPRALLLLRGSFCPRWAPDFHER